MVIHSALILSFADSAEDLPESPLEFEFDVHYAESLDACFTIAAAEDIDLILLDADSCRDKLSFVRQLLKINQLTARTPVMLLSSCPELFTDAPLLQEVNGVVSLSLPPREMAASIRRICAVIKPDHHQPEQYKD